MKPRSEETKSRFRIEKLEERIAPIVHPFVGVLGTAAAASGGAAGGTAAVGAGAIGGPGNSPDGVSPVNAPVPLNNPGVGPA